MALLLHWKTLPADLNVMLSVSKAKNRSVEVIRICGGLVWCLRVCLCVCCLFFSIDETSIQNYWVWLRNTGSSWLLKCEGWAVHSQNNTVHLKVKISLVVHSPRTEIILKCILFSGCQERTCCAICLLIHPIALATVLLIKFFWKDIRKVSISSVFTFRCLVAWWIFFLSTKQCFSLRRASWDQSGFYETLTLVFRSKRSATFSWTITLSQISFQWWVCHPTCLIWRVEAAKQSY